MCEYTLTGFEVEKSFSSWRVKITGDLVINGIKTRVYDSLTFEEASGKFGIENPKETTFNQAEVIFGRYYKQKISG
jgi:hypothetical protein